MAQNGEEEQAQGNVEKASRRRSRWQAAIPFDRATWDAVDLLAREQMKDLPEITEEAFRDLLKKYGRSADVREALKLSARRAGKKKGA